MDTAFHFLLYCLFLFFVRNFFFQFFLSSFSSRSSLYPPHLSFSPPLILLRTFILSLYSVLLILRSFHLSLYSILLILHPLRLFPRHSQLPLSTSFPLSLCHSRSLFVIPALSLCHSREGGNPEIKNPKRKIKKFKIFYCPHFFI